MNKKGETEIFTFQIGLFLFAIAIGLALLYYTYVNTNDTSFQAKLYEIDIRNTLTEMSLSRANAIKIDYNLPENFEFTQDKERFFISDGKVKLEINYVKKENFDYKAARNKDLLILEKKEIEKNEKIS